LKQITDSEQFPLNTLSYYCFKQNNPPIDHQFFVGNPKLYKACLGNIMKKLCHGAG